MYVKASFAALDNQNYICFFPYSILISFFLCILNYSSVPVSRCCYLESTLKFFFFFEPIRKFSLLCLSLVRKTCRRITERSSESVVGCGDNRKYLPLCPWIYSLIFLLTYDQPSALLYNLHSTKKIFLWICVQIFFIFTLKFIFYPFKAPANQFALAKKKKSGFVCKFFLLFLTLKFLHFFYPFKTHGNANGVLGYICIVRGSVIYIYI